jgi:hypothetical protein
VAGLFEISLDTRGELRPRRDGSVEQSVVDGVDSLRDASRIDPIILSAAILLEQGEQRRNSPAVRKETRTISHASFSSMSISI